MVAFKNRYYAIYKKVVCFLEKGSDLFVKGKYMNEKQSREIGNESRKTKCDENEKRKVHQSKIKTAL